MKRANGPRTAAGKAKSSQNARTHGLNTAPRPEDVSKWFNLILNNSEGAFEEPNSGDQRREVALRLAIAEACFHRALYLVEAPPHNTSPGRQVHSELLTYLYDLFMEVENLTDGEVADLNDTCELQLGVAVLKLFDKAAHREQRLYLRYLGEARAQRRKALKAWCAFIRDENQIPETNSIYTYKESIKQNSES